MPRRKKDGISVCFYLERILIEQLEAYCEVTGLSKTKALERMMKDFLDRNLKIEK